MFVRDGSSVGVGWPLGGVVILPALFHLGISSHCYGWGAKGIRSRNTGVKTFVSRLLALSMNLDCTEDKRQ